MQQLLQHPSHRLILASDWTVAVMGRGKEFLFVDLRVDDAVEAVKNEIIARHLTYCGVISVRDNVPGTHAEADADSQLTMSHAVAAFSAILADDLKKQQMSADFCERLYSLPDLRT